MPFDLGSYTANFAKPLKVSEEEDRVGLFPIPTALVNRKIEAGQSMSALSLRLFHALLFLSWNMLAAGTSTELPCAAKALRELVGRAGQESNADLDAAFGVLASTQFQIPRYNHPTSSVKTTILQRYDLDGETGTYCWCFSDAIAEWCCGTGVAYGWLDVRATSKLRTVAALRLYELGSVLVARTYKPWVEDRVDQFRAFLEIGDKYEGDWSFEHRLLTPAISSVAKSAGFTVKLDKPVFANRQRSGVWKLTFGQPANPKDRSPGGATPICAHDFRFASLDPELEGEAMGTVATVGPDPWIAAI